MKISVVFTSDQLQFLIRLLHDAVQLYEHQAAALALLDGEAARDLAQERLDASQDAAELVGLLAQL